ncbi:MAG: type II secretion system F family protein [Actinobacteria bacterium]|nr:type II secretion system F family protein [Actinomycetota bacterium]
MPETYAYKARDRRGELVTGELVADNQALVLNRLREMGQVPVSVEVKKTGGLQMDITLGKGFKLKDLAVFSRQFATMINSGLSLLRALAILEQQTKSKQLAKIIGDVRLDIEQGSSLSQALSKHPKAFNRLFVAMVRAGEAGGVLDSVLLRLADQIEREVSLRQKIKSAMTYPIVVLFFVLMILAAMLLFIVPQFATIYADLGGTLPLPTRLLLAVSEAFRHYWYIVILIIVGTIFGIKQYRKTEQGRRNFDAFLLKLPVFGPLFHKTALSRFCRTLSALLRAGVPILQSLDIVSETVNNAVVAEAIGDVKDSVQQGESMSRPLVNHDVFPTMLVQMLAVGEETGAVDSMLEKVADFYDDEITATVDALTSLIEPIMIAVIGGMVGAAVVALYMPMFNIINLIE